MTTYTILYIVLAAIVAFMMVFFQYFYKVKDKSKEKILLSSLRFLSIFSLLLLLINPKIKSQELEEIRPTLNVLVDNSSSITYAKQQDVVRQIVEDFETNEAINKKFLLNLYSFSGNLSQQDSLTFQHSETNILKTLKTLETLNSKNVSPTILITDGNQTYGSSYEFYKSNQQIYPIVVGDTISYDDLRISQINVNTYSNLNNQFPVEIFLQYDGKEPIKKRLSVRKENNTVFSEVVEFSDNRNSQRIQFNLPASSVGIQNYTAKISTLDKEKNTLDNVKNFSIDIIDEQAKILILSEIKHPDISMIKRSIEINKQRKVSIKHNLNEKIQLNDYQLVIVYQPTNRFADLFKNIIADNTNFFIITGAKTDWKFLNSAQSFFKKNSITKTEDYSAGFNTNYDEFITEDFGFSNFPPLRDYFGEINFSIPFKTVLYQTISDFTTDTPLLATFSDNNKRGAVLFGENSWRWRMLTNVEQESFEKFDTFFNKLIQYLSSNKRSRQLEIEYQPIAYANSDVLINAQYFDANYTFDENANLVLTLTNQTETRKIPFTLKNNTFEIILSNLQPGNYSFKVTTENQSITKNGAFTVLNYDIEKQFIRSNTKDLAKIAEASGGNIFYINATDTLFTKLLSDKRYSTIQKSTEKVVSLIEWKWLLGLVLLFFSLEWFIRKYRGLI